MSAPARTARACGLMPGELTVPLLYRKILRAAKLFPSIKRNAIIEDIKVEFREGQARHAEHTRAEWLCTALQGKLLNLPSHGLHCCGRGRTAPHRWCSMLCLAASGL